MDELYDGRGTDVLRAGVAEGARRQQDDERAQPFAAAGDDLV
jgi:hypothetical protein